jgi:hypothetical protein
MSTGRHLESSAEVVPNAEGLGQTAGPGVEVGAGSLRRWLLRR